MELHGDPYEALFAHRGQSLNAQAVLTEKQWYCVVSELVAAGLLDGATAARFNTEYRGARSFAGFQEQLLRWLLPPDDPLRSLEDVLKTLEDNMSLVERMVNTAKEGEQRSPESSVPAFIARGLLQIQDITAGLKASQAKLRRDLREEATTARLFGNHRQASDQNNTRPASSGGDAWQFQREHLGFLQKEERRRRAVHVERHTTDATSRTVLLESFPRLLEAARDILVRIGSAIVAENDSQAGQTREQTKKELVVVLSLKRRHARADEMAWLDTTVHAHRELLLSPYYQQYIGCHEVLSTERCGEDQTEHLYCFELAPVTTLEALLATDRTLIMEQSLLLRYFAREILLAMIDFHEQSTHTLRERLTPRNVLLSPSRRRVLLGKLEFGPSLNAFRLGRTRLQDAVATREKELLGDLAVLLFAMLFHTTLPTNLNAFRDEYIHHRAHQTPINFTSEFIFSDGSSETSQIRACRHDRFSVVLLLGSPVVPWLLQSRSSQLQVWEQTASPMPTFTFVASHPGEHQLVFVPLDRGTSRVSHLVVNVSVDERSYLYDPPSRLMTLIRSCTQLSLRRLLDEHQLFQPLTENDMHALDALLEQCSE